MKAILIAIIFIPGLALIGYARMDFGTRKSAPDMVVDWLCIFLWLLASWIIGRALAKRVRERRARKDNC